MELTEIKKSLYKEKPIATRIFFNTKRAIYACKLDNGMQVNFKVPQSEMSEGFSEKMEAQLLIRWIS